LTAARVPASARQLPAAVKVSFLVTRRPLPREAPAFLLALVFPLLSAPVSVSQFSWVYVRSLSRGISSLPISVWV
jgi:hypothetical protein